MDILEKSWQTQNKIEEKARRLGKGKYGRVLKMTRKPTPEEFTKTCQITGIGMILIGGLGFLIYLMWNHIPQWLIEFLGL